MHPNFETFHAVIAHILERTLSTGIRSNQRWALGEPGEEYILGVYQDAQEARDVFVQLVNTDLVGQGRVQVMIREMSSTEIETHISPITFDSTLQNLFFPESMINGRFGMSPLQTDQLASFLAPPRRRVRVASDHIIINY